MKDTIQLDRVIDTLFNGVTLCDHSLVIAPGQCLIRIRSNSIILIEKLTHYFSHVVTSDDRADIEVIAIERQMPCLDIEFIDWSREQGKTGRKDSYYDLPGARLVRKVRTGMVFLQSANQRISAGPCLRYKNQVINFINAQYMNWLLQKGWLTCHAAGVVYQGRALGIAGFSGGGKSTLMLQLLENERISYLTNDRLFLKPDGTTLQATGIPKLPRINPGTIVHNPRLQALIPETERKRLLALPSEQLWQLEDKYDVMIEALYSPECITIRAPLAGFLVLNWQRDSDQHLQVQQIDLARRQDLLAAIMKSPGPFYQYPDGHFYQDQTPLDEQSYLDILSDIPVYEANGTTDFDTLARYCIDEIID
ncbi:HprK-related kinase B [Thiohalophilus sp.]|uniref:HprK-related kinase B n=1 Tax=Thiohalophilus sp. TaxID=3028392 RepID=UPI003974894F